MNARDDGGPAFPVGGINSTDGATLRDLFALAAMHARVGAGVSWSRDQIASSAYAQADAMLAERAK